MKKLFFPLFAAMLLLPTFAAALELNLDYPKFGSIDLNTNQDLSEIVGYFYFLIVGIAGLAAFVMLVWGGVQWLLSGALPSQASDARDKIRNAIIGLLLVLASFLIVQVINPELTLVGGFGLPQVECRRENPADPFSPCIDLTAILPDSGSNVALTANGEEFTSVLPGSSVTLNWQSDIAGCSAGSEPIGLWDGAVSQTGTDTIDLSTIADGTTVQFALSCDAGLGGSLQASAFVVISSGGGGTGDPPAIAYFQAKHTRAPDTEWGEGPFECCGSSTPFPDDQVTFRWSSPDATQCVGEQQFVGGTDPRQRIEGEKRLLLPPFTDVYRYTLKCLNGNGATLQTIIIGRQI